MYDYMRSGKVNLDEIIDAADVAIMGNPANLDKMISYLNNSVSAIRYWGATGILILGDKATEAKKALKTVLDDESPDVAAVAAEALYKLGETEPAKKKLLAILENPNAYARCHALNAIDGIEDDSPEIVSGTIDMIKRLPEMNKNRYDLRAARGLLEKWGIDPLKYNLVFNW